MADREGTERSLPISSFSKDAIVTFEGAIVTLGAFSIGVVSQLNIGSDMASMMGSLLGTTATEGGYVLGGIFFFAILIIGIILASKLESKAAGMTTLLIAAGAIVIAILLTWWPPFTAILAIIMGAVALVGPLSQRSGTGGA